MAAEMPRRSTPSQLCCDSSLLAGEQLFGTAPRVDVWFLLEYRESWAAKALQQNSLPEAVRARLLGGLEGYSSRAQFIRQEGRRDDLPIAFFVAVTDELSPRLYAFQLRTYEDLLALELPAVVAGEPRYAASLSSQPLFLICANGRRDPACAREGLSTYRVAQAYAGDSVWQTTHLGGHRFAATGVFFPHGVYYGRITAGSVPQLIADYRQQQIRLEHYRGRACYDKPVQAAAYYVRELSGLHGLPGFHLIEASREADARWAVRFLSLADRAVHTIWLEIEPAAFAVQLNSGDSAPSPVSRYRLSGYSVDAAGADEPHTG